MPQWLSVTLPINAFAYRNGRVLIFCGAHLVFPITSILLLAGTVLVIHGEASPWWGENAHTGTTFFRTGICMGIIAMPRTRYAAEYRSAVSQLKEGVTRDRMGWFFVGWAWVGVGEAERLRLGQHDTFPVAWGCFFFQSVVARKATRLRFRDSSKPWYRSQSFPRQAAESKDKGCTNADPGME